MTKEVAEATCACLIAQAEEAERTRQMEMVQERMILEEFGRCLMQVIESAGRTKGIVFRLLYCNRNKLPSYLPDKENVI